MLDEASVVAINTKSNAILAVGTEAKVHESSPWRHLDPTVS